MGIFQSTPKGTPCGLYEVPLRDVLWGLCEVTLRVLHRGLTEVPQRGFQWEPLGGFITYL